MPSLPTADVPTGATDDDNVELKKWGEPRQFDFDARDHVELARMRQLVLFDQAREFAGSRAYALTGNGALLELAVMRLAVDFLIGRGYTLTMPPLAVKENAMVGTGYFPLGEENAYVLEKDKLFLTGTSEVGLVALQANRIFSEAELPARFAGLSTCFRREAGAAGRDTRGLYRVHQFQKVEQVVFAVDDDALTAKMHADMLENSEQILQLLELPYRVVAVCTGEMGLGQVRKHDIETWMPSRNAYGETHSCSTLGTFQSRRLNIRYKTADGAKRFVHTLNNTAVASPRILVALLENHQLADGSIHIPSALRQYMYGNETI
jgi:seryl-tRNA synthetase